MKTVDPQHTEHAFVGSRSDTQLASTLLAQLHATEESYGWSIGMRAITHALLERLEFPPGPVLELGCGGGTFASELAHYLQRSVTALDLYAPVAATSLAKIKHDGNVTAVRGNLLNTPFPKQSFGTIIALDSFDQHGVNLLAALAESRRLLEPGGLLFLRVSAHRWLQSHHDCLFGTAHRFGRRELIAALRESGFMSTAGTFANLILLPPVALQRWMDRIGLVEIEPRLYSNPVINRATSSLLQLEARWLRHWNLPTGISLYVAARKADNIQ